MDLATNQGVAIDFRKRTRLDKGIVRAEQAVRMGDSSVSVVKALPTNKGGIMGWRN